MDMALSKTDQVPVPKEIPLYVIVSTEKGIGNSCGRQRCFATDIVGEPATCKASQLLCQTPAVKEGFQKIWLEVVPLVQSQ